MQDINASVRKICIAAIKRHTIKPINYPLTTIFESQALSALNKAVHTSFEQQEGELPITLTYIDLGNWTLITTQQVVSKINDKIQLAPVKFIHKWYLNDFKGYKDKPITYGDLALKDNTHVNFIIETGAASMINTYAIMTLAGQETASEIQIKKTLSRYEKRGFFKE